jgi:hypothetical protein
MVNTYNDYLHDDLEEIDLPPAREENDIVQAILNEEINPDMPTDDVENGIGYLFIYYFYNGNQPEIQFEIPDTWEQWATTFATMTYPILWETQLVGELRDREGVEMRAIQTLEEMKRDGLISDYRIRHNYIQGYE